MMTIRIGRRKNVLSGLKYAVSEFCNDRMELLKSLQSDANDFIRKPHNPMELIARTDNLAAYKRFTDQLEKCRTLIVCSGTHSGGA